jgi:hypothetical protein
MSKYKRLTDDILVYENFLTKEECDAIINILETQVKRDKLSWTPITFYESYSSVLPKDNDEELEEFGLSPTFFSDLQTRIMEKIQKKFLKLDFTHKNGSLAPMLESIQTTLI